MAIFFVYAAIGLVIYGVDLGREWCDRDFSVLNTIWYAAFWPARFTSAAGCGT